MACHAVDMALIYPCQTSQGHLVQPQATLSEHINQCIGSGMTRVHILHRACRTHCLRLWQGATAGNLQTYDYGLSGHGVCGSGDAHI